MFSSEEKLILRLEWFYSFIYYYNRYTTRLFFIRKFEKKEVLRFWDNSPEYLTNSHNRIGQDIDGVTDLKYLEILCGVLSGEIHTPVSRLQLQLRLTDI